jgi:hypothetical protein
MEFKLLTILNPQLSTKLDLQPTFGHSPSTFIEEPKEPEQPIQDQDSATSLIEHQQDDDNDTDQITDNDTYLGPTLPTPQMINLTQHQKRHTPLQKEMTLYFQEFAESPPSVDPIHTAMLTINATASSSNDKVVDKYLPEPQSFKAVLKLDDDVCNAWLHAIKMEIKNLIDHNTFILGKTPRKDELIIPVKHVLIAKQTASGKLEKLKARIVARGNMEKRRIKKTRATVQKQIQKTKTREC